MNRYYASEKPERPWLKVAGFLALFATAIGVLAYMSSVGYARWLDKLVVLLIITALVGFSFIEQLWPVISINAHQIVIHRLFLTPQTLGFAQIERLEGTGAVLMLRTKSRTVIPLNLLRLSEADRELAKNQIVKRISNCN